MKVIIVGAGVAGLTLALFCEKLGIEVKLYEKTQKLKHIGGGVLLWPHGLHYLQNAGLSLQQYQTDVVGCLIQNAEGKKIFYEPYQDFHALIDGPILPIDRSLLQTSLVQALKKETLHLGKTCVKVISDNERAQIFFDDGTHDSADLIVGADGIHSTVRREISTDIQPDYTHYCWWGGIVEQRDVTCLNPQDVYVAMGVGKMCMVWPTFDERFMWYLPVKMPLEKFHAVDGLTQLKSICTDWTREVQAVINAPKCAQQFHLAIHAISPHREWTKNRVVIMGDAAHALGPLLGQGASQAIEDAFVLAKCLETTNDIFSLLTKYENLRHEKYQRLHQLENQAASMMLSDDPAGLASFEEQIPQLSIAAMYQDLIPLVDKKAREGLLTNLDRQF